MKRALLFLLFALCTLSVSAQNRFPKPDFESGYQYPEEHYIVPGEAFWSVVDIFMLIAMMSIAAWAVIRKRSRTPVIAISLASVLYFGFFRYGCVCSIGSVQNVAIALTDSTYVIPLTVVLFFALPLFFALLFGRVFCSGVCPFGALQDLVNIKNYRLSKILTKTLGILPWIYLAFAVMFAVTRSGFIICRFDPFVGIFRLGGETALIIFGVLLLIASLFTGRPFCRFICPYGALLSLFSRVSVWKINITANCINCQLCHNSCPVDAIMPPYENRVKESRAKGVKRILNYFVLLLFMTALGTFLMRMTSDTLSRVNKNVRLYEMVLQNEIKPQEMQSLDLQAFYGQGGSVEVLKHEVDRIKSEFNVWSAISGGFIGLVIGLTLISLSVKRTRKTYEIDRAGCVNCGRCFSYCPQNLIKP